MRMLCTLAVLVPALAFTQVPSRLGFQGRLIDANGAPVTGIVTLTFKLFPEVSSDHELWSEEQQLGLTEGFYAAYLGNSKPLAASILAGADLYLELSVDGQALSPRMRVASVPFAMTAGTSTNVAGNGTVNAASFDVSGGGRVRGDLNVGGSAPLAKVDVTGAASVAGSGTLGVGANKRDYVGALTKFNTEVVVGDVITAGGQSRVVTAIADDSHLTVDLAVPTDILSAPYTIQKAVARLNLSDGTNVAVANAMGNVGIGTRTPGARLDVAGEIVGTPAVVIVGPSAHNQSSATGESGAIPTDFVLLNSSPATYAVGAAGVTVRRAGYYEIEARLLANCPDNSWTHLGLLVNGAHAGWVGYGNHTDGGSWRDRRGSRVMLLEAGAIVAFRMENDQVCPYRWHSLNGNSDYTSLRLIRLN